MRNMLKPFRICNLSLVIDIVQQNQADSQHQSLQIHIDKGIPPYRLLLKTPSSGARSSGFPLARTAKSAEGGLLVSSMEFPMYIGTVRCKISRSKPDRVFSLVPIIGKI